MTEVAKADGCELDFQGKGAFTWWATQADSEEAFLRKLNGALEHYKLLLIEVKESRQFADTDDVANEIFEMVQQVRENEDWVLFGTFHTYRAHDA
jgi:hypothetical protein